MKRKTKREGRQQINFNMHTCTFTNKNNPTVHN